MYSKMLRSVLAISFAGLSTGALAQQDRPLRERDIARESAAATYRCDALSGDERMRCLQSDARLDRQGTMGIYTQRPGDSGPGAVDKTNPGLPTGTQAARDAGTSSAGSGS